MRRALVRPPAGSYADHALTREATPRPVDLQLALAQHEGYVGALVACGLEVTRLPPEAAFPDSTFIQDTGFRLDDAIVVANPTAPSRRDEAELTAGFFSRQILRCYRVQSPATIEGGDVLLTEDRLYVGLSSRTNRESVIQLQARTHRVIVTVPVPDAYLHLLTGCSYLGGGRLLATERMAALPELKDLEILVVPQEEEPAANVLVLGKKAIHADGYPRTAELLEAAGFEPLAVPISEFEKRDGGVTCLSLLF